MLNTNLDRRTAKKINMKETLSTFNPSWHILLWLVSYSSHYICSVVINYGAWICNFNVLYLNKHNSKNYYHKVTWVQLLLFSVNLALAPFSSTILHELFSCSETNQIVVFNYQPLTGEVNNIDHLVTIALVKGCDIFVHKWTVSS